MSTKTWNAGAANWTVAADWTGGLPVGQDDVVINSGAPVVSTAVNASSGLPDYFKSLTVGSGGGFHISTGSLDVVTVNNASSAFGVNTNNGTGGGSLTVNGVLTNSGVISLGNSGLSKPTSIFIAALTNFSGSTKGSLILAGGTTNQLKLTMSQPASAGFDSLGTGNIVGAISLSGNSLLQLAGSSSFSAITAGSSLTLNGANAFIADANLGVTSNNALSGLTTNNGTLDLENGAQVSLSGAFVNSGVVDIDTLAGAGGSNLATLSSGTSTNSGTINIGNTTGVPGALAGILFNGPLNNAGGAINITGASSAAHAAELDVGGFAGLGTAGVLDGVVNLTGDAVLNFQNVSQINKIASTSVVTLNGAKAGVTAAHASALTGLIEVDGKLSLENGASLTNAIFNDYGSINIDDVAGAGGSSLISTNGISGMYLAGKVAIGNATLSSATVANVDNLVLSFGSITLTGSSTTAANAAELIVAAGGFTLYNGVAGPGALTLSGYALLELNGGQQITRIDATRTVTLHGPNAFIADAGSLGSNSALTGLAINNGTLALDNGANLSTNGPLENGGSIQLNTISLAAGPSEIDVGGALTNDAPATLSIGGAASQAVVTAGSLSNSGTITLNQNSAGSLLQISGPATNAGGTVTIGVSSILSASTYKQSSGSTNVYGALNAAVTLVGGSLEIQSGASVEGPIAFGAASHATLTLDSTSATKAVTGLASTDTIALAGLTSNYSPVLTGAAVPSFFTLAVNGNNVTQTNADGSKLTSRFNVTGQAFTSTIRSFDAAGDLTAVEHGGVTGAPYTAYTTLYSGPGTTGNIVSGNELFYTGQASGLTEVDLDGSGNLIRALYAYPGTNPGTQTGFEADYVASEFAGGVANYLAPVGAALSAFAVEYDNAYQYIGSVYTFNYTGQTYDEAQYSYTAGSQPTLTEATFSGYTGSGGPSVVSFFYDNTGASTGVQYSYAGIMNQAYTSDILLYNSANVLIAADHSGYATKPFSSQTTFYNASGVAQEIVRDYTSPASSGSINGQANNAYEKILNPAFTVLATAYHLDNGGNLYVGAASNVSSPSFGGTGVSANAAELSNTLTGGDWTITGGGTGETFNFA